MSALWKYIAAALLIALAIAIGCALYFRGTAAADAARADKAKAQAASLGAELKQSEANRAAEHAQAVQFATTANQYEQDKADAEAHASQLAADLRAERVRLRPVWRCEVPRAAAAPTRPGQPDAATADRDESAARIVRAAAEADAKIRALQALLTTERNHP
jgi:hypothetical protein